MKIRSLYLYSFRFKSFSIHLLASLIILSVFFILTFMTWYPKPFTNMMPVWKIFWVLVFVYLTLGPSMTAIIANPRKPRHQFARDIFIIILIQTIGLVGGVRTIYLGRPIYLAFDTGIFYVVTQSDIIANNNESHDVAMPSIFQGPISVYVELPEDAKKQIELVKDWLSGSIGQPAYKPELYRLLSNYQDTVNAQGMTFDKILPSHNDDSFQLEQLALKYGSNNLLFYLLINSNSKGKLITNKINGEIVGFLPN
ncbi:MAG: hypothetical protein G8D82_20325 [gamma proteobacterium symbiont of Ctena orbiculata]|nr:hypothetical protein [Candidatus Thiodiazotropha taylori]MCW4315514.1 hypothetical protein [Candidatus Thiodiazotropha taylori]